MLTIVSSVLTGLITLVTAWFAFRSKKDENKTSEVGTIFSGYNAIVISLQSEVARQKQEIAELRKMQNECEARNDYLDAEIEELRKQMENFQSGSEVSNG